jgi:hypothetical protein
MGLICDMTEEPRIRLVDIIRRYFAEDSMEKPVAQVPLAVMEQPVAQVPRAVMEQSVIPHAVIEQSLIPRVQTPSVHQLDIGFKRTREDLELESMELDIRKKRENMKQDQIRSLVHDYSQLCSPTTVIDERARLMFKDIYLNMALNIQTQTSITNGEGVDADGAGSIVGPVIYNAPAVCNKPVSISSVATSLGHRLTSSDAIRVGIEISKSYVKLHGKAPSKHDQLCDGRITAVNNYTENDKPLIVDALRALFPVV